VNPQSIQIGGRTVGGGAPAFILAEVAQAHHGSYQAACEYVEAVAESGADAVKFQTHLAAFESTLDETFRVKIAGPDRTRFDYWKRMEFSESEWRGLAELARKKGLIFLSSGFSLEALRLLGRIGMPAWKIGSGEFRSYELLEEIRQAGGPVLLSTGMSGYRDIEEMVGRLRRDRIPFGLFQCTSRYPTRLEEVGLNVIGELRRRFDCPVGLSDHSGSIHPGLAALAQGADMLEVHVKLEGSPEGPDATSSLTPRQIRELVVARDAFHTMAESPVDKDQEAERLQDMRRLFTKSLAPARDLEAGTTLTEAMLVPRKPGTGIPFSERDGIVGRRLRRAVSPLHLLTWEDLDEPS
jgi:N,N'-diacetyllegionaminate synthase